MPIYKGRAFPQDIDILQRQTVIQELGTNTNNFRTIKIPLDTALEEKEIEITGTVLYAIAASDNTATIDVKINDRHGQGLPFTKGFFMGGLRYSRLYLDADAQAGKYITLMYGVEETPLSVVNPASITATVEVDKANDFVGVADVATIVGSKLLLAADATRRTAYITNLSGNANPIRIGGAGSIGAAQGIPVRVGETLTLNNTDAIWVYCAGVQNIAIGVEND